MDTRICCICKHPVEDRPGDICGYCEYEEMLIDDMLDWVFVEEEPNRKKD
jgi:hypothetical protein